MDVLPIKVVGISGSLREGSTNTIALNNAMDFAREAGADVEAIDVKGLNLPLYDYDIEVAGPPEGVRILKEKISSADLILISSPEYNRSVPGELKNAIDWASRMGNSFNGKTVAVFGVSNGRLGTAIMQSHLKEILLHLGCIVVPRPEVYIGNSADVFEDGRIKDEKTREILKELVIKAVDLARKLK